MIRGTTPTFTFTIRSETVNLGEAENVYVTIRQGANEITKTGEEISYELRTVNVYLSQEESLKLKENTPAEIQINWTYYDGTTLNRAATVVKTFNIQKQLLPRVIE